MPTPDSPPATIVLCGGQIRLRALPVATTSSNAMLPVLGRPVIGWILEDLLSKGARSVTVVLRRNDEHLRTFVERVYARRLDLRLAWAPEPGSILASLLAGVEATPSGQALRVILGDTLIEDSFDCEPDFVYIAPTSEPHRWCVVDVDGAGHISGYHDKAEWPTGTTHHALAGFYRFSDAELLRRCTIEVISRGARELSSALAEYGRARPIAARQVQTWFDFGNVDNVAEARHRLLRPRYFNSLTVDALLHTVTKRSFNRAKLHDEAQWYQLLPPTLQVLAPRLLSVEDDGERLAITQEFYGYPSLAELFVYGEIDAEVWHSVLRRVLDTQAMLMRHAGPVDAGHVSAMYLTKTVERVAQFRAQHPEWAHWLGAAEIAFNGKMLRNLEGLLPALKARVDKLAGSVQGGIVHGDLCMSNVLFDVPAQIVRLIDPRGSFGAPGLYGDPRYDLAKLRHSVCGGYDFLMADMFWLEERAGAFTGNIDVGVTAREVAGSFDRQLVARGLDLDDIRCIEATLFLSMPPLHEGQPERQKYMYLHGLAQLNEVL